MNVKAAEVGVAVEDVCQPAAIVAWLEAMAAVVTEADMVQVREDMVSILGGVCVFAQHDKCRVC